MSKKLGKLLLVSASIATVSIVASILCKKLSSDEITEDETIPKAKKESKYITLKIFNPAKDPTINAIKRAAADKTDIDD